MKPRIRFVPLSKLTLDDRNGNRGTARGRELLESSLRRLGAGRSVLVDRQGRIIAGNKTIETARKMGLKNIAVIETDGDTLVAVQRNDLDLKKHKKAIELAVADNRASEIGLEWDPVVLASLDLDLKQFWNDAELTQLLAGIDGAVPIAAPDPKMDQAAQLQKKWGTKCGQIWQIAKHRLMCGDSTKLADVEALMGRERAKLMSTDPPYLVNYVGGSHPSTKANRGSANKDKDWSGSYREIEIEDGQQFFVSFLSAAKGVLHENAPWYVWHAHARQMLLQQCIEAVGGLVHQQIIWLKSRAVLTYSHFMWNHEPCFYGWLKGHQPKRRPPANEQTVWQIGSSGNEDAEHPTQKPLELFARPMRWHLSEGEIAYEPFSGSGTSLCAAEATKRVCYAMEIEPKFVAVALERLSEMGLEPKPK